MGFEEALSGDELLRELRADCGGAKAVADVRPFCSGSDVIPQPRGEFGKPVLFEAGAMDDV